MKKLFATCVLAAVGIAHAQDVTNPNVQALTSSNLAFAKCVEDMSKQGGTMTPEARAMFIMSVPRMCREGVFFTQVKEGPTGAQMAWDVAKFGMGLIAQYKGQALIWGAVTGIVDRMGQSTDTAVQGGYNLGSQGIEAASKPPVFVGPPGALEIQSFGEGQ